MVRIENSYLSLGEFLILGKHKCFINKWVIKKGFTRKETKEGINGEYDKLERKSFE